MARRYYSSTFAATTLSSGIGSSDLSVVVAAMSGAPASVPWTGVIDRGTASEELVEVTAVSSTTLTITRGVDGSTASAHSAGAAFEHVISARDFDEANEHVNKTAEADDPHPQYAKTSSVTSLVPTGSLVGWPTQTAPDGWLRCNGAAVSRATYADLFAVIGTSFGVGDGSSTFNLPDSARKFLVGADEGFFYEAGDTGGDSTVFLTEAMMPAHTHSVTVTSGGNHVHSNQGAMEGSPTASGGSNIGVAFNDWASQNVLDDTGSGGSHTHTATAGATGGTTAVPIIPPYLGMYFIIKT